jgi:N-methylhydantoinase A
MGLVRIAVDIGGTFTDVAALDEDTGEMKVTKVPTTPKDFAEGFLNGVKKADVIPRSTNYVIHGTTVATNAVIQRALPVTALLTTRGFEDILEIMRGNRPMWGLYDIRWRKPVPIVPRRLRLGIVERIDSEGRVVERLDEKQVRDAISRMKELGVKSVAVCFLFSNLNPSHERRVAEMISESMPYAAISLSSDVNPQIREYERMSTTAIDASVKPVVAEYLDRLEKSLSKLGFNCPLMIMKSSGGMMSSKFAKQIPIETIESGPAGGVIGAAILAASVGEGGLLAIDMGGTTFKVSVIEAGTPRLKNEGEVEWGIPYRIPMIDLSEIGTGGGSIAWVDRGGILRVGPQSAGANPGPVCYRIGGDKPTFTDASLFLGRIDPDNFLGGEMKLDRRASEEAISRDIAKPLGMDILEAAAGIVKIAEANMLGSMRVSSVERGYDPRDFVTVAYGGAGPMVATSLARELGSPAVIIPPHPGIFSSIGMLYSDLRLDLSRTFMGRIESVSMEEMTSVCADLESKLESSMRAEDFTGKIMFLRSADMRYVGQNYEVTTPVPQGGLAERRQDIVDNFNKEHKRLYGHSKADEPVEMLTLRVAAIGGMRKPARKRRTRTSSSVVQPRYGQRDVYFEESNSYESTPAYERDDLGTGIEITGPAIIHEMDSTTVVRPRQLVSVDDFGNLVVRLR